MRTPAAGVGTESFVDVGFPFQQGAVTDFTLNPTATNWTVAVNPDPDGNGVNNEYWSFDAGSPITPATPWPGVTTGLNAGAADSVTAGTHIVRFATTALTASTRYCFDFGAALTNSDTGTNGFQETSPGYIATYSTTGGGVAATPGSGTLLMRSNWSTYIVGVDGTFSLPLDQVVISAIVPPIFQFVLTSAVSGPGTVDSIPASGNLNYQQTNDSGGVTATVHTNAKNGWVTWTKSANQGLKSASAGNYVVPTVAWNGGAPSTLVPSTTEGYGQVATFNQVDTHCTGAIAPSYAYGAANANQAGKLGANFQQVAGCNGGTSNGDQVTFIERAAITLNTPAATDYTDTITVVGAGNF